MTSSYILGVDPGLKGGLCLFLDDSPFRVASIPLKEGRVDAVAIGKFVGKLAPLAFVEWVTPFPRGSRKSAFTFGMMFGGVLAALDDICSSVTLVEPARWKKAIGVTADKETSFKYVADHYPGLDVSGRDGMAEAVLIAEWGYRYGLQAGVGK